MTSRMEIQTIQSQLLTTLHFIQKSGTTFLKSLFLRMSQIDQITVMRKNIFCRITKFLTTLSEKRNTLFCQRRRFPLTLITGKQSKCLRPNRIRIHWSILNSTRCRHMCSNILHYVIYVLLFIHLLLCILQNEIFLSPVLV